jgi:hypothetical protein
MSESELINKIRRLADIYDEMDAQEHTLEYWLRKYPDFAEYIARYFVRRTN